MSFIDGLIYNITLIKIRLSYHFLPENETAADWEHCTYRLMTDFKQFRVQLIPASGLEIFFSPVKALALY